uniref:NYN domain-containing protein n=1 Tax=Ornithinimicrobium sp. CNJ-824 TaxID=1904966 RepID=UPI0031589492
MDTDASSRTRIAVLIDCDNVSSKHAEAVLEELAKYGTPTVKRAYGDWTTQHLVGWKPELHRHAIQPVQQFAYTVGKNSSDSALIIDAMDLLWQGNVEAFALVSSDSDFTRLATRLRESGKRVFGLGRARRRSRCAGPWTSSSSWRCFRSRSRTRTSSWTTPGTAGTGVSRTLRGTRTARAAPPRSTCRAR